ncbi:hypothetical protein, partial [Rhodococcus qingshengii]|uniref:hypothetical protein n=1 Tax=Rhodococcus qingshengii TaxID=334542 RepID=UPI0021B1311E
TGVPSRQRWRAGLDQNPVRVQIIIREGASSRDPQVSIIPPHEMLICSNPLCDMPIYRNVLV